MRISDWSSDVVLFRSSAAALGIWRQVAGWPDDPECCLINLYRDGAKMGLHQDRDEAELAAPVVSISLGDDAVFRLGGTTRGGPARALKLASGDRKRGVSGKSVSVRVDRGGGRLIKKKNKKNR